MRRGIIAFVLAAITLFTFVGCSGTVQPEYMHPYAEGVDPDTVTTVPLQTRTTSNTTTTKATYNTTVPTTAVTTKLVVPQGCILCPMCLGVKVVCKTCLGTDRCKAEILNESTGIYVRKYVNCEDCSEEDPGYMLCELCYNKLYIEE